MAVIFWFTDNDGNERHHLAYNTSIADDVMGNLNNDEVMETLYEIKKIKEIDIYEN